MLSRSLVVLIISAMLVEALADVSLVISAIKRLKDAIQTAVKTFRGNNSARRCENSADGPIIVERPTQKNKTKSDVIIDKYLKEIENCKALKQIDNALNFFS